jgi:hypothetical protein
MPLELEPPKPKMTLEQFIEAINHRADEKINEYSKRIDKEYKELKEILIHAIESNPKPKPEIIELRKENEALKKENSELRKENISLKARIIRLWESFKALFESKNNERPTGDEPANLSMNAIKP